MGQKPWYKSRMLAVNVVALLAVIGLEINAEEALAILAVINIVLRTVTKKELTW